MQPTIQSNQINAIENTSLSYPKVHLTLSLVPSRVASSVIGGHRTVFWNAGPRLRLFSQNVAVSESRHRLLFYPTRKRQKHRKIPFRDVSRVREVDYRKGRC